MAEPLRRPAQVGRPAGVGGRAGLGPSAPVRVSPATVDLKGVEPRLNSRRERILLGGDTNSGKSYAWARMALAELQAAHDQGREPHKFYIIDTDDTCSTMMNEGDEFEALYWENGGNVYPYPAFDWIQIAQAIGAITRRAKRGDWIVADVVNRFYDDAQDELASRRGYDKDDKAIADGLADKSRGFGGIEPGDWIMIRRIHDSGFKRLVFNTEANLLALCHLTEVMDVAGRERREILTTFDEVGLKPMGAPRLPGQMDTIVFLWSKRVIQRDERGRRAGKARTERFMSIIKDRGKAFDLTEEYGEDFYPQLQQVRREKRPPLNITVDEARAEGYRDVRGLDDEEVTVDTATGEIMEEEDLAEDAEEVEEVD